MDSAPDGTIGAALENLRTSARFTQKELADAMRARGFRWLQPTVTAVEQGKRPLRLTEAAALASILGVDLDAFLCTDRDDPLEELIAGLVADVIAHRSRRDAADARVREGLARRDALVDLQRARAGLALGWSAPQSRLLVALGWLDSARLRAVLEHLGVEPEEAHALARAHEAAHDPDAAAEFTTATWEALQRALPAVGEPSP